MADMLVNQSLPLSPGHPVTASLTACNISPRIPPLLRYKHAHGFAHAGQLHVSMLDMSRTLSSSSSSSSSSSPLSSAIASASSAKKSRKLSAVATLVAATSLSPLMISKESKESNASLLVTPSPSSSPSTSPRKSWKLFSSPAASSSSSSPSMISKENGGKGGREDIDDDRVTQIHTVREFDEALVKAKSNLVVVEYAASHSVNSRRIYPAMVELSRTCQDVAFLLVMGDESAETKALCARAKVDRVPHFSFYKNGEIVHEETAGMLPETLVGDVLYYGGDADAPIQQLHGKQDVENLLQENIADGRLVVLDVGLKHCGPCVKVYPTFVKLAKQMKGSVIFARMNGDENTECMEFLRSMGVVEVPTFLFIRAGKVCGRYVGSGKGELIGEILRYQGVRVTY